MALSKEVFDSIKVSYFKTFTGKASLEMPVCRILKGIKSDYFKDTVLNVRKYRDSFPDKAKSYKTKLHAVTFSGLFPISRNQDQCAHYNNLLVIDIDHIERVEMPDVMSKLYADPYISTFWVSPSGCGYKGLVFLSYEEPLKQIILKERHKKAFNQIFFYLYSTYGIEIDRSGKDISRLCFMSWVPHLVIKDTFETFNVKSDVADICVQDKRQSLESQKTAENFDWNHIIGMANYPNNSEYRFKLGSIYKKLKKRNLSITDIYDNWVKVAFAIAASIHPIKGRELFLKICRLDGVYHDEHKSEHLIYDAYQKHNDNISFGTIIYLAKQIGLNLNSKDSLVTGYEY